MGESYYTEKLREVFQGPVGHKLPWYSGDNLKGMLRDCEIPLTTLLDLVKNGDLPAWVNGLRIIHSFWPVSSDPPGHIHINATEDNICNFSYKREDLIRVFGTPQASENQRIVAPTPAPPIEQPDHETDIRNLQIAFESDTEISIRVGKQKPKTYSYDKIGFGREDTKGWRGFIQILKSSDHSHHLGAAHGAGKVRNKSYDANKQILREINKKLISFLKEFYNLQLPDNFQLFELKKDNHPGTYGPKFIVSNFSIGDEHHGAISQKTVMADIEKLSLRKASLNSRGDETSEKELSQITEELQGKIILATDKKWLGPNRAASYLNPPTED